MSVWNENRLSTTFNCSICTETPRVSLDPPAKELSGNKAEVLGDTCGQAQLIETQASAYEPILFGIIQITLIMNDLDWFPKLEGH